MGACDLEVAGGPGAAIGAGAIGSSMLASVIGEGGALGDVGAKLE